MKIRTKILTLLALLCALLIVLEYAIQERVLMPSFAALERDEAKTAMRRIDYALGATLDSLQFSAIDWGNWADVYRYVREPSADFVAVNLTAVAMKQLQINALFIIDASGRVVVARARDLESGHDLPLDLAADGELPRDFPWRIHLIDGSPAKGLLRTNLGPMMIAAAPILDGSGTGPSRGMVLMGHLLGPAEVLRIGAQAQVAVNSIALLPAGAGPVEHIVETDAVTRVERSFDDLGGQPAIRLQVEIPRRITGRGRNAVYYASFYLIGAAVVGLFILMIALNRIVLAPLARVTRHAVAIGEGADLSARLNLAGRDEMSVLAREFDRMVASVAASRRLLVDQSFDSGFAELAKGVVHNLGNAMTPLGVRLSKLAEALRDAPLEDIERAVVELAGSGAASARRADLDEFLTLGHQDLRSTLAQARKDVAVIQRQVLVVQTALSELMRSTRNEHVIESVALAELVAQTLEIVPDACRHRLVVESDASLREVGVVRVARTVLRLILQNLIINAADAVREAGREKGLLRVAASLERGADCEQLHLRCEDNGVGIARDDLERVFEQGFSTKPRDTNHGVGLHWCANAVAALGGRIWAVSDGPGRGAALHLTVPVRTPT